jgi:FkbM family methyltransferase
MNNAEKSYSQYGQDLYADRYFGKKINGIFLDIGAYDGISGSNTYFFENFRSWKGLCVEPIKTQYELLCKNRKCYVENYAIFDKEGTADFTEYGKRKMFSGLSDYCMKLPRRSSRYKVQTIPLQILIDKYQLYEIDLLSLDVEEVELEVLKSIDFTKVNIKLMFVENHDGHKNRVLIPEYLSQFGYKFKERRSVDDVFEKI